MFETIEIIERQLFAECIHCKLVNKLDPSCLGSQTHCVSCEASLYRDVSVKINKVCPICGTQYDRSKVTMYTHSADGVCYWSCYECGDEPRAMYLSALWRGEQLEPCGVCGRDSALIMLTELEPDNGEWLCVYCASTQDGNNKLAEHWRIIEEL
jgi:hypothetical protein